MKNSRHRKLQIAVLIFCVFVTWAFSGCGEVELKNPSIVQVEMPEKAVPGERIPIKVTVNPGKHDARLLRYKWEALNGGGFEKSETHGDPQNVYIAPIGQDGATVKITIELMLGNDSADVKKGQIVVNGMPSASPTPNVIVPASSFQTSQPASAIKPGEFTVLTFTSGAGSGKETGRQTVAILADQPGPYSVLLENANRGWSGHWLIWDYLALQAGGTPIWEIGEDEAPPNYTEKAFSEFCDPKKRDCTTDFTIGVTSTKDFAKELNDGSLPRAKINFTLTEKQVKSGMTLVLSTLYATHDGASQFKMKVTLSRGT
jgi:hypothetical protein